MKKILLFASAVLFSMMSFAVDITITSADAVNQDGVKIVFDKANGQTAPAWYEKGLRLYAKNTVTISANSNITEITFNWEKQGSKDFAKLTANVGNYSHPSSTGAGTWTGSAKEIVFTVGEKGQLQLNTLSVFTGEGGSTPETPEEPEEPETPTEPETPETPEVTGMITCAEAATLAAAENYVGSEDVTVYGYVVELGNAKDDGSKQCFYMSDTKGGEKQFYAYWAFVPQLFKVGDYVTVTGPLKNYKGTIEIVDGQAAFLGDTPETPDTPDTPEEPETPVEPGETTIEIPAEAAAWDIPAEAIDVLQARAICAALQPGQNTGKKYYVMGYVKRLSSKHAEAVEKYKNARFYMENVKGGNSDEEFVAFQVKGIDGGDITNPDVVAAGDFVIVYGELTHYKYDANSDSDYETVGGGKAYIWKSTNPLLADTESGVEDVIVKEKMTKVIKDGQMYIIRDGKAYNVLGAQL